MSTKEQIKLNQGENVDLKINKNMVNKTKNCGVGTKYSGHVWSIFDFKNLRCHITEAIQFIDTRIKLTIFIW